MKEGVIIQQGAPKEIYMKPKNNFVANFVGTSNLIKPIHFKHTYSQEGFNKRICIRPEDIRIRKNGRYCGKVKKNRFRGQRNECVVFYKDAELVVSNDNDSKISEGEEVRFDIERYHEIED